MPTQLKRGQFERTFCLQTGRRSLNLGLPILDFSD